VSLIAGRYQPLDTARAGVPQRARDLQTAQTVVLRDLPLPNDGGDVALARADAAKRIFHPSLVTLFDVVPLADHRVLLAYEFVPAQSVALVSGGQPFNARRAAEIVTEIADAVAELHARGIVHGSISQNTVLITLKGKAKLDRLGDPSLHTLVEPRIEADFVALTDLLVELAGKPSGAGLTGMQAIQALVARVRSGKLESVATFAAMLRRVGE